MDRFKIMKPSISFLNILTNKNSYECTIAKIFKSKPRNSMNSGISYNAQFKLLSSNPDTQWNTVIILASSSHLSSSYLPLGELKFNKVTYILTNPNLANEFSSINKYINVSLQAGKYIFYYCPHGLLFDPNYNTINSLTKVLISFHQTPNFSLDP